MLASFLWLLALVSVAAAAPLQVDQSNTVEPEFGSTITWPGATAGQMFTPQLDGIDFVRLALSEVSGNPAFVHVNVRAESIDGLLLGSTSVLQLPAGFGGSSFELVDFFFGARVPLTPGDDYVLEIIQSGYTNVFAWGNRLPSGSGGRAIIGGPYTCCDFYYVEGTIIPEGSTALLMLAPLGILGVRLLLEQRGARNHTKARDV